MQQQLKIEIRNVGATVEARIQGMPADVPPLCTVIKTACDADPEVFEDFQALAVKILTAMLLDTPGITLTGYYATKPPGG